MPETDKRVVGTYLNNLSKLGQENLDEDDSNLPIHDYYLPVVGLRVSVPIVEEPKFPLDVHEVELMSLLKDHDQGYGWDAETPNNDRWKRHTQGKQGMLTFIAQNFEVIKQALCTINILAVECAETDGCNRWMHQKQDNNNSRYDASNLHGRAALVFLVSCGLNLLLCW